MYGMSPRERVYRTLHLQLADRMPRTLDVGASDGIDVTYLDVFRSHTGAVDPAEYFDYDIRHIATPLKPGTSDFSRYYHTLPPGAAFDELGVAHVPEKLFPLGHYLHPWQRFTSVKEMLDYPMPTFNPVGVAEKVKGLKDRGYAVSAPSGSISEWVYGLRGMAELLVDMVDNPDLAQPVFDRVAALDEQIAVGLAEAGVDIICFYDDTATQAGMLISPDLWRKWMKPRWSQIFRAARHVNPEILIFYHSCGNVEPIIPELIDLGITVMNPIQPEAMDPIRIKREYGDRICLWGGIGSQSVMPSPSVDHVRDEVRRITLEWKKGGGAIVSLAQTVLPDVPWENVVALVDTINQYGVAD
jgi:uroporphyrinogen decarboxylase